MENLSSTLVVDRLEYEAMGTKIAELEMLVKFYEHQLLLFKRRQFGSASEKTESDPFQMNLFGAEDTAVAPPPEIEDKPARRKKRVGKREEDLSGLPVERIDYELPESERVCPECGGLMRDVGVKTRRELKLIPAKVVVLEHATHSYACRNCEQTGISVPFARAETPLPLLKGSLASPSLVAHIAVQKYAGGMPLYRLENGFRYDDVRISRQNMSDWVILCSQRYLEEIYGLLIKYLLQETVLHADETVLQVLREAGRAATANSYEWLYRTSGWSKRKIAIYDYRQTRGGEHPRAFLKGFTGLLHTDGHSAYRTLPPNITVIGCWVHVRRRFENILKTLPKEEQKGSAAYAGMGYISALFAFERKFEALTAEERYQKRLEKSKPVSDAFFAWAQGQRALPKSPLGEAVGYALSQRKYLENIYLDGRTEISNNRAERSIKPFVIGRKAWLFSNTPAGARASSVMYSIIETAKENGLHPYRYLEFLLQALPKTGAAELEALLPWSETLPGYCRILQ